MKIRRPYPLAALLLLAGCTYWAKPGGTPLQLESATSGCETSASVQFPVVLRTVLQNPGFLTPMRTECRAGPQGQNCYVVGGEFIPPSYVTVDVNDRPRRAAFRSCMTANGWTPASTREEAEAITRSGLK